MDGTLKRTVDQDDYDKLIENWDNYFQGLGITSFEDVKQFVSDNPPSFSKRTDVVTVDGTVYKIKKVTGMAYAKALAIALNVQRPTSQDKVFKIAINYTPDKENALGVTLISGDEVITVDDGWHTTNGKMLGQIVYMIHKGWIERDNVEAALPYILFSVEGIEVDDATPERVVHTIRAAKFISRNNDTTLATVLEQMFAALMDRDIKQRKDANTFFNSHKILGIRPIDDEFNERDRANEFSEEAYDADVGTPTKDEFYWTSAQYSMFDNRNNKTGHFRFNEFASFNSGFHAMTVIKRAVAKGSRHRLNAHLLIASAYFIREIAENNNNYIEANFGKALRIDPNKGQYLNTMNPNKPVFGGGLEEFDNKFVEVLIKLFGTDFTQDNFTEKWRSAISRYLPYKVQTGEEALNTLYMMGNSKNNMWQGMLELMKWQFATMYPNYVSEWNIPRTLDEYVEQFDANEDKFTVSTQVSSFDFEEEYEG
jgi:hypothetical protein